MNYTEFTKSRRFKEKIAINILKFIASISILTTIAILFFLFFETFNFFTTEMEDGGFVKPWDFLFGTKWTPLFKPQSFGILPLVAGTLLVTVIAVIVALILGLSISVFLSEYAPENIRRVIKPILEILAGIPTVVYGFFAALTVAPFLRNSGASVGLSLSSESALAAGLVMGIMIIPLISSLSDDVINAVPQSLREGSAALGSTQSETVKLVILPAALPGIVSAILLALSRAIGETMIVVMAAGVAANLTFNPFESVTAVTVQIVVLLIGDQEFDSAKTLAAFALGFTLFIITLLLNVLSIYIVRKYREQYD